MAINPGTSWCEFCTPLIDELYDAAERRPLLVFGPAEIARHLRVRVDVNVLLREGEVPLRLVLALGRLQGMRERLRLGPLPGTCQWPRGIGLPW